MALVVKRCTGDCAEGYSPCAGGVITEQPISYCVPDGDDYAEFYLTADGEPTYQWQYLDGDEWVDFEESDDVLGVDTDYLELYSLTSGSDGQQIRCLVDGTASDVVILLVGDCAPDGCLQCSSKGIGSADEPDGGGTTVNLAGTDHEGTIYTSFSDSGSIRYERWANSLIPEPMCDHPSGVKLDDEYLAFGVIACGTAGLDCSSTSTSVTQSGDGECNNSSGGAGWIRLSGTATRTYSDERTVADALDDWVAGNPEGPTSPPDFTEWGEGECSAMYAAGTTSFTRRDAKWRIRTRGNTQLLPSTSYDFTVEYWRRPIGGAEETWELYQTLNLSATSDATGNIATSETTIPNADGYITEVRFDCAFTPSP